MKNEIKKNKVMIKMMNSRDLKNHFNNFLILFAENTRGHVNDQIIKDEYILQKAKEIFGYLDQNKVVLFGMFDANILIGFIWAYPRIFLEEKRIYINSLIISDKYRSKGYGELLIREVEKYSIKNNIFAVDVSTASFKTDAIRFYKQHGYKHERVQMRKDLRKNHKNNY